MNLGAMIALLKLAQDVGITEPAKKITISPIARKITIAVVPLTYEQVKYDYRDVPTGEKKLGRPGLRPKGL